MIVTPHLPENGKVSIHLIDGDFPSCYKYLSGDSTHMNHRIKVKELFGLQGNISIYNSRLISWYARLQWLRLPILPIERFENDFKLVVNQLRENPGKEFGVSVIEEYLGQVRRDILSLLRNKLNSIDASSGNISFERVCEHLLVAKGYKIDKRNCYDNKGGDIDLWCIRERSYSSPFEAGETTLFIQVKKHLGTTDEVAVNQLVSMMKQHPHADGCVMSLADDFTERAVEIAESNGILLMNGETICTLLASQLMQSCS